MKNNRCVIAVLSGIVIVSVLLMIFNPIAQYRILERLKEYDRDTIQLVAMTTEIDRLRKIIELTKTDDFCSANH